ncbi:zinc-dependent peptidase [Lewinella sp. JB7]|uniref:zinc-dependent peptidase n=1 Tax=Lewinella sp. JB7 TaxID=2962887 RepID=UPI0020C9BE19|nr:zinc-dependent peptidase [Lewinella sp. JB7]MCP9237423.1 zinc-dependent peptidase [Lewinella sp. JB7]
MDPVRATYLAALCLILLGAVLTWQTGDTYTWLMLLPAIAAAGVYTLSPQIRWWYWKRNPPDLPTDMAPILERFPLYRTLDLAGKRDFRRRAFLIREATEYTGMAIENIPPDVRLMVAASAATVTFYWEEFLIPGFENVVFYPHLFPTPEHDRLHSSELYPPDGVIIYTLNYFVRSVVEPDKYLHLGIYEYSRALFHTAPGVRTALLPHTLTYPEVEALTGFSESALREFIGLEELDLPAITLTIFHTHGPIFAQRFPEKAGGVARELANGTP